MSSGDLDTEETKLTDRVTTSEEIKQSEETKQNEETGQSQGTGHDEENAKKDIEKTASEKFKITGVSTSFKEIPEIREIPSRKSQLEIGESESSLDEISLEDTESQGKPEDELEQQDEESQDKLEGKPEDQESQEQEEKQSQDKPEDKESQEKPEDKESQEKQSQDKLEGKVSQDKSEGKQSQDRSEDKDYQKIFGDNMEAKSEQKSGISATGSETESRRGYRKSVQISELTPFGVEPVEFSLTLSEASLEFDEYSDIEEEVEASKEVEIDRTMYYQMHDVFKKKYDREKMRNLFLHSRLARYYLRRKMIYVLREPTSRLAEIQTKYEKSLDAFGELVESSDREKSTGEEEIYQLSNKRDSKSAELEVKWQKLMHDEAEYGKGLTFDKTGKANMDKLVERFVRRQKTQMALMIPLRLDYIRLRNKINEKLEAMEALDHLVPGYRIMDYEQMKIDNRDLTDKIEEKDGELVKLRRMCQHTIQILAHKREKLFVLDLDIKKLLEESEIISMEYDDAREQLYYLRHERNSYRVRIKRLKNEQGLLASKMALKDMEKAVRQVSELREQVENNRKEVEFKADKIKALRTNIQRIIQKRAKQASKTSGVVASSSSSSSSEAK